MRDSKGRFIKGYKPVWSKKSREKLSKTCKERGTGKWMTGRKLSAEIRAKIKKNNAHYWRGKDRPEMIKDNPTIGSLHKWVETKLGKAQNYKCLHCDNQARDWANKDHSYKRNLNDYLPLCRSCHKKYDLKRKLNKDED